MTTAGSYVILVGVGVVIVRNQMTMNDASNLCDLPIILGLATAVNILRGTESKSFVALVAIPLVDK